MLTRTAVLNLFRLAHEADVRGPQWAAAHRLRTAELEEPLCCYCLMCYKSM